MKGLNIISLAVSVSLYKSFFIIQYLLITDVADDEVQFLLQLGEARGERSQRKTKASLEVKLTEYNRQEKRELGVCYSSRL